MWLYGLVIVRNGSANLVPLNSADNWLHFVTAFGMIALGVTLNRHDKAGIETRRAHPVL